jgi:hypothetical protein
MALAVVELINNLPVPADPSEVRGVSDAACHLTGLALPDSVDSGVMSPGDGVRESELFDFLCTFVLQGSFAISFADS